MRHDWEDVYGSKKTDIAIYGRRICKNCGIEQKKEDQQSWGKVTGYVWFPKAGRCKANPPSVE